MENFIMREIRERSKDFNEIYAVRTRTSSGFCSISIHFSGQSIKFDNEEGNDHYELQAIELAKILESVAHDRCELPQTE